MSSSLSLDRPLTLALIGNPNTGKSSLFNALCGMNARVGNFPGVTVEKKIGSFQENGHTVSVIDLPGTYSLAARSDDEWVSVDILLSRTPEVPRVDIVMVIVDAAHIERNLYLFSQVRDLGLPTILVLNMWDRLQENGVTIDLKRLEQKLGIPVIATSANRRQGMEEVRQAIRKQAMGSAPPPTQELFPASFIVERSRIADWVAETTNTRPPNFLVDRWLFDVSGSEQTRSMAGFSSELPSQLAASRVRLQEAGLRIPAIETKLRYGWIRELLADVVVRDQKTKLTISDRIDRWLTHRVLGVVFFLLVMFLVFQAIYSGDQWLGSIFGLEEEGLFAWSVEGIQSTLSYWVEQWLPDGPLRSLINHGMIAGVGGVITFLPQIAILFMFISILEDCGYMARAAFLMDKLMTRLGLTGKSFLPLLSSFACAIPGIMGTRVIENRRDRMVTILIAPLMSCSARFPVYVLMISAFVPPTTWAGGWIGLQACTLFVMQLLGAVVAIPIAFILKKWYFPGPTAPFVMELPSYKWPSPRVVLARVWERVLAFLARAGSLILATSILVWAAGYFPSDHGPSMQLRSQITALEAESDPSEEFATRLKTLHEELNQANADAMENSFLGMAGKWIEPAVMPLGWDWRIGVGVMASFPAREVIIATLGTIYRLGGDVNESDASLQETLQAATWPDGRPVFTLPVAMSIMVFFALCAQCAATLMVIKRETNSWKWPLFTFVYMTSLAYLSAFATFQILRAIGL